MQITAGDIVAILTALTTLVVAVGGLWKVLGEVRLGNLQTNAVHAALKDNGIVANPTTDQGHDAMVAIGTAAQAKEGNANAVQSP